MSSWSENIIQYVLLNYTKRFICKCNISPQYTGYLYYKIQFLFVCLSVRGILNYVSVCLCVEV